MGDPRIRAFFKHIGIDGLGMSTKENHMFALIDTQNAGRISMEQFVNGCLQFKGGAKPIDIALLDRRVEKRLLSLEESVTQLRPARAGPAQAPMGRNPRY